MTDLTHLARGGARIALRVTPRARRNAIQLDADGTIRVHVTAPPEDGKANAAVAALRGFPTSVVPATIILDKQHRVAAVYLAEITDDELRETVSEILAEEVDQT